MIAEREAYSHQPRRAAHTGGKSHLENVFSMVTRVINRFLRVDILNNCTAAVGECRLRLFLVSVSSSSHAGLRVCVRVRLCGVRANGKSFICSRSCPTLLSLHFWYNLDFVILCAVHIGLLSSALKQIFHIHSTPLISLHSGTRYVDTLYTSHVCTIAIFT